MLQYKTRVLWGLHSDMFAIFNIKLSLIFFLQWFEKYLILRCVGIQSVIFDLVVFDSTPTGHVWPFSSHKPKSTVNDI